MPTEHLTDIFADCYSRWLAGKCPCCGGELEPHYDDTPVQAIGEDVVICGRCVANGHMRDGFDQRLLARLVVDANASA